MYTIIFGCGNFGKRTLEFLGRNNVDYFCDNNPNMANESINGVDIISYETLLDMYKENDTLIVLGLNGRNSEKVAAQLESDNIFDFVAAKCIPGFYEQSVISSDILQKIKNHDTRNEYIIAYLRKRLEKKTNQVDYFKRHASISHMSPAVGDLRKHQLEEVRITEEVLTFLNENCPVNCWIISGTLIGKMRHNGFIPWDHDIDFGIMREDVAKLIEFFEKYSTVLIPGPRYSSSENAKHKSDISIYANTDEVINAIGAKYFLMIFPDFVRIYKYCDGELVIALELFVYDFYSDNITIDEYHKYASDGFKKKRELSCREWFDYSSDVVENSGFVSKTPTNKILPGIDNFIFRGLWNIEEFVPYDTLFPLREVDFEGIKVLCPNKPEEFIFHDYPDWREFPDDVGDVEE